MTVMTSRANGSWRGFLHRPPWERSMQPPASAMRRETIRFAGLDFELASADPALLQACERFSSFVCQGSRGGFRLELRVAPESDFLDRDCRGWEQEFSLEEEPARPGDGEGILVVAGLRFAARVDFSARCAVAWLPSAERDELIGALENLLRIVTARLLVRRRGVLLHSAGFRVVHRGALHREGRRDDRAEAVLFVGRSGAGKSTLSLRALQTGHDILSDDLNAVWHEGGRWVAGRVPFSGDLSPRRPELSASGSLPVGRLLLLRRAARDRLENVALGEMTAGLLACCPFVNRDSRLFGPVTDVLLDLLKDVPHGVARVGRPADLRVLLGGLE